MQKKKKKKKFTSVFVHRHATVSRGSTHFGIIERMFSPPSLGNYRRRHGVSRATDRSSIVRGVALRKPISGKIRTVSDERCSSRCRAVCVYKWGRGKKVSLCRLSVKARGIVCLFVCVCDCAQRWEAGGGKRRSGPCSGESFKGFLLCSGLPVQRRLSPR